MSVGFTAEFVPMTTAESIREEILRQMPPDVRARVSCCMRKEKAFQIAAADYYMRLLAAEEGLGTMDMIRIGHEGDGKPFLSSGGERICRNISISHCNGALYLCMADSPVGCDVERIRRIPAYDAVKGFFSEEDLTAIRASDDPERKMIRIWTRREAFAKLTGIMEGLKSRSFHDKEAVQKEHGILFTEGQEKEYLFTVVQYDDSEGGER